MRLVKTTMMLTCKTAYYATCNCSGTEYSNVLITEHETKVCNICLEEKNLLIKCQKCNFYYCDYYFLLYNPALLERAAWVRSPPSPTHKTCLHSTVGDLK